VIIALLDSGPLGLVTHPRANPENAEGKAWLSAFLAQGHAVLVPEITYYEVRRELRRSELKNGVPSRGLANLEAFVADAGLIPITSEAMRLATEFWAQARHLHIEGAPETALDADMILCAQAETLPLEWNPNGDTVVVATTNVKHLSHFADARHWQTIS
jgi:predicted nucleic acid-binding protein